ncbi:MAG: glycosyltransferase family 4 protein [Pseudonocardiales bacterium]|nr:glycosyltransferase family 4 protein [Pseudonocardiales bacterium]MBV9730008.1 glycosyltransferase family 4 protein [Pseudonocardiales bacterium]
MRVGLVIFGSLETRTGGYLYDRRLLDHLGSRGDQTHVVSLPVRTYLRHLADNFSPSLASRLAGERFDVLLQDELNHPSLVMLNRWLKARAGYPIVTLVHLLRSSEPRASPLRRVSVAVERRYLATVDAAVFNCETTREAVERLLGHALPGVVAYPGCDHMGMQISAAEVTARARVTGPLRVLSVANVVPGKGLHVLVAALDRLPAESWRLTVAGSLTMDRAYVNRLQGLIGHLGLVANVNLLGSVPHHRIADLLSRNHVLAVPSSYEALGIAYLEAMRFGLPVIATSAGGAHEVVDEGREGFFVAPGDVDALSGHLRLLGADRELLLRMGLAARRRAERHPTWEESFERARDLLCSLVASHQRHRR